MYPLQRDSRESERLESVASTCAREPKQIMGRYSSIQQSQLSQHPNNSLIVVSRGASTFSPLVDKLWDNYLCYGGTIIADTECLRWIRVN